MKMRLFFLNFTFLIALFTLLLLPHSASATSSLFDGHKDNTNIPLPDFSEIKSIQERKQRFILFLSIQSASLQHKLEQDRIRLLAYRIRFRNGDRLNRNEYRWIFYLAKHQGIKNFNIRLEEDWIKLLKRTDIIPFSMLASQAILESAWGTSRFAKEGNNYFGIWCFQKGCGMVPKRRDKGAHHEVRSFVNIREGMKMYINILNTKPAFQPFRDLRYQQRQNLEPLSSSILVNGLKKYSAKGTEYFDLVRTIIRQNHLHEIK